jgi:CDGSH-type Zn-finger protein
MSETTVQLKPNGPYLVTGPITLIDETGNKLPTTDKTWLCRCGQSAAKPFCDGSHKKTIEVTGK